MFKVNIFGNDSRVWSAIFETELEAQEWLNKQLLKEGRLQEPTVTITIGDVIPQNGTLIDELLDDDGSVVQQTYQLPPEASYSIVDISQSDEVIDAKRLAEYPSINEVLHVILDSGIGSQEWNDLQARRSAVKTKYPKGQ